MEACLNHSSNLLCSRSRSLLTECVKARGLLALSSAFRTERSSGEV